MKKILGVTFGGLQKKLINLVVIVLLIALAMFAIVSVYENRMLVGLVEETREEQEKSISESSEETMYQVLQGSLANMTELQANIADKDFSEVVNNISMLQSMAEGLLENKDSLEPMAFAPPDPANDGKYSAMVLYEEGVDYTESEYLGIIAHMSGPMIALASNSEKVSGCYVGLADGTHLGIDRMSSDKYDEDGKQIPFPVTHRPWYRGAAETGDIYFTGIEEDAFNKTLGITCSAPIYADGQLIGVAGIDILLGSMEDFIGASEQNANLAYVVNDKGQVILAPDEEGPFSAQASNLAVDLRESDNKELAQLVTKALKEKTGLTEITLDQKEYYVVGAPMPTVGWAMISVIDKEITEQPEKQLLAEYDSINNVATERFRTGTAGMLRTVVLFILISFVIGSAAALYSARKIVHPIEEMTRDIYKGGQNGVLFKMKDTYRTDDEIEDLAKAFADLSRKTRKYISDITEITREKERVSTELQMANRIQNSMIPHVFPPFPDRREFDLFASMEPAREVGGDFYDFFLIDDDHLCLVMADVSGKGVPAALFMMISKVILQSCAMLGKNTGEILAKTNEAICSSNQVEMFVTVWLGIMEISTGKITAANAGHEYPVLMKDGKFSILKDKHGLVIGGMNGVKYREYEIDMEPGDKLFLYTDGIPEAADEDFHMFGTERMVEALNMDPAESPQQILENIKNSVEDFVDGAEQFDDMTMLCIEYKGSGKE